MYVIARLEFELAYYDANEHISHYTVGNSRARIDNVEKLRRVFAAYKAIYCQCNQ